VGSQKSTQALGAPRKIQNKKCLIIHKVTTFFLFGNVQKSPSSKAAAILARGAYFQYVSTAQWRERRWRLFSTFPPVDDVDLLQRCMGHRRYIFNSPYFTMHTNTVRVFFAPSYRF